MLRIIARWRTTSVEQAAPSLADYDTTRKNALSVFSESIANADSPEPVAAVALAILQAHRSRGSA